MSSATFPVILQYGSPGAIALVSAYLGVRLGVAKLKRERAFDRRLEWYEKGIDATRRLADAFGEVRLAATKKERDECWKAANELRSLLSALAAESRAYASPKIHRYLTYAMRDIGSTALDLVKNGGAEVQQQASARLERIFVHAEEELAAELRLHLGLGNLYGHLPARVGRRVRQYLRAWTLRRTAETRARGGE